MMTWWLVIDCEINRLVPSAVKKIMTKRRFEAMAVFQTEVQKNSGHKKAAALLQRLS
jgi:hypothetical protein